MQRVLWILVVLAVGSSSGLAQGAKSFQTAISAVTGKSGSLASIQARNLERNITRVLYSINQTATGYPTLLTPAQVLRTNPEALLTPSTRQYVLAGLKNLVKKDDSLLALIAQIEKNPPTNYTTAHEVRKALTDKLGQAALRGNYALEHALSQRIVLHAIQPRGIVYIPFLKSDLVAYVGPRQWVLGAPEELPQWVGLLDMQEAVGVIILVKRDGKVIRAGITMVDAQTDLEHSADFFHSATEVSANDRTEVYIVSKSAPLPQLQRLVQFIRGISPDETLYFMDLQNPGRVALHAPVGTLSTDFGLKNMIPSQQLAKDFDINGHRWEHPIAHRNLCPSELMQPGAQ